MELHARLVHAEAGRRVVEVRAVNGERPLGTALGEAGTAQEAEDLALQRLLERIGGPAPSPFPAHRQDRSLPVPPSAGQIGTEGSPVPVVSVAAPSAWASAPSSSPPNPQRRRPPSTSPMLQSPPREAAVRPRASDAAPSGSAAGSAAPGTAPTDCGAMGEADASTPGAQSTAHLRASVAPGADRSGAAPPLAPQPVRAPMEADQSGGVVRSSEALETGDVVAPAVGGVATSGASGSAAPLPGPGSPQSQLDPDEEPPADPEDWSQELAALDLQLRRLGWGREQEGIYLQRAFAHPSRSRLTRYSDLRAYLQALEGLERGSDPASAAIPLRRSELLAQGDGLLRRLGWTAEQGRAFLERELQRVSRQQLSDVQLLHFNMLLEGELLSATDQSPDAALTTAPSEAAAPGRA